MLNNYTFKDIATSEEKDLFKQKGLRNTHMELCVQDAVNMLNTDTYVSKNGSIRHMITKGGSSDRIVGAMLVIAYHGGELKEPFYSSVLDKMVDKDVALLYVWDQTKDFRRASSFALAKYGYDEIIQRQLTDEDINSISWLCFIEAIVSDFGIMRYADESGRFDSAHFMRMAKAWRQYANINLCGDVKAAIVETAGIKSKSQFNLMMFTKVHGVNLYDDDAENTMHQINQIKVQKMEDVNALREAAGKSKKYCYTEKEKESFIEGHVNAKLGIKPVSLKTVVNAREYCQTIKAINTATNEIPEVAESYNSDIMLDRLPEALSELDEMQMQYVQMKFYENLSNAKIQKNLNLTLGKFQKFEKNTTNTLRTLLTGEKKDTNNTINSNIIKGNGVVLADII